VYNAPLFSFASTITTPSERPLMMRSVAERNPLCPNTSGESTPELSTLLSGPSQVDSDLARVVEAWTGLSDHIKVAILALVRPSH
jgi:hypothetical protein